MRLGVGRKNSLLSSTTSLQSWQEFHIPPNPRPHVSATRREQVVSWTGGNRDH
jgi:hypothetical protein